MNVSTVAAIVVACCAMGVGAMAQPFATGPRQHAPEAGQNVDARLAMEDLEGYVWVSGPGGTYRFDGFRYLPASLFGLPMREAAQIEFAGGALWVLLDEELWWFDGSRFRQFAGVYNAMAGAGEFLYVDQADARRIAVAGREGQGWKLLSVSTRHPRQWQMAAGRDGRIWFGTFSGLSWVKWNGKEWEDGSCRTSRPIDDLQQVVPVADGWFLASDGHSVIRFAPIANGVARLVDSVTSGARHFRQQVFASAFGTWVMANGGLLQLLPDGKVDYFRYAGPQRIYSVRAGRSVLWGAAGRGGLFAFSRDRSIEWVQPQQSGEGLAKAVVRRGERLLFGRTDLVYEVVPDSGQWSFGLGDPVRMATVRHFGLPAANGPYEGTTIAPDGTIWHILPKEGAVHVRADGGWIGTAGGPPGPRGKVQMRKVTVSADGRVWVASRENLWEVDLQPPPDYRYLRGGRWEGTRTVSEFVQDAEGRLYAVADGGLLRYEEGGAWGEMGLPPCLLSGALRTAAVGANGVLWVAYRDRIGFTQARPGRVRGEWRCAHYRAEEGHPGETTFLRLDRKQRLWRGTQSGVRFAPLDGEGNAAGWRTIGEADGWMSGDATDVFAEEPDGSYLVGVGPSLQRIPEAFLRGGEGARPLLEGRFDGTALRPMGEDVEPGDTILFSSLPAGAAGMPLGLEYRTGDAWRPMEKGGLPVRELAAGTYGIDVRFAGAGNSVTVPVRVPWVWWRNPVFHGLLVLAGLAGIWRLRPVARKVAYRIGKWRYMRSRRSLGDLPAVEERVDWAEGRVVRGRYEVERLLARGGFSDVYEAVDRESGAAVVIKRLRLPGPMAARPVPWLKARFLREVGVASLIRDPGVLPILDTWFDELGTPHMVLPRVNGPTLRTYLEQRGPLPAREAGQILRSLAGTVQVAHDQGVVHCDLKPENILILSTEEGTLVRPIVIDFGTAALHLQAEVLSETTLNAGSIRYMAPEQILGRYSTASDVYAFASVALEVITQRSYASLDVPIDRDWERNFRRELGALGLDGHSADLMVSALRWDPTQRRNDILRWTEELLENLPQGSELQ